LKELADTGYHSISLFIAACCVDKRSNTFVDHEASVTRVDHRAATYDFSVLWLATNFRLQRYRWLHAAW